MATPLTIPCDVIIAGSLGVGGSQTLAAGCVNDTAVATPSGTAGGISYAKIRQLWVGTFMNGSTATAQAAAETRIVRYVYGAVGTTLFFKIVCDTKATSTAAATVDLKRSTAGGAFASILSSTLVSNSSSTDKIAQTATINTSTLLVGDILEVTCALSGSGNYPLGLTYIIGTVEDPV